MATAQPLCTLLLGCLTAAAASSLRPTRAAPALPTAVLLSREKPGWSVQPEALRLFLLFLL